MQITDIADAMIVGRLFEGLLAAGTVIVTTSNLAPDQLYRNGLNRQLFLPFIALIRQRLDVVSLDSPTDYRLGRVKAHETFLTPISPETDARLQDLWQRLTDTARGEPLDIDVLGRKLHVPAGRPWLRPLHLRRTLRAAAGPAGLPGARPELPDPLPRAHP